MEPYYRIDRGRIVDHYVADSPLRVSSLRSLGAHANVFAVESFVDEIAVACGEDPIAFRLRHLDDERAREVVEAVRDLAAAAPRRESSGTLHGRGLGFARYKNQSAYAAVLVEVELDKEIHVRRVWAAVDAGMVVSLGGLKNQSEGGIMQAIGWTLNEQVTTSGPRIASRDWESYRPLRFVDAPSIEMRVIDRPDAPPFGAGEAFAGPTSAAIANAIADASGVRLRAMPFTRERFVAALD